MLTLAAIAARRSALLASEAVEVGPMLTIFLLTALAALAALASLAAPKQERKGLERPVIQAASGTPRRTLLGRVSAGNLLRARPQTAAKRRVRRIHLPRCLRGRDDTEDTEGG